MYRLANTTNNDVKDVRGIWFWGKPGVGKSYFVRKWANDRGLKLFIKPQSKWWDGYSGEPVVLLDDIDTNCLHHYLKIWTDKYACSGEVKGGTVPLLYKYFFITSNYTIEDLFSSVPMSIEPIKRRCQVR